MATWRTSIHWNCSSLRFLHLIASVALAGLLVAGAGCGDDDPVCPGTQTQCGDVCVDIQSDDAHCGACDNACDTANGYTCSSGACTCGALSECDGVCADFNTDPGNCGTCGNACPDGQVCVGGNCESGCPGTQIECGDPPICVDTDQNDDHCGACDNACDADGGQNCVGGECICVGTNMESCGGACVNTGNDPNHCGDCDNACADNESCQGGACVDDCDPQITCDGSCVDPNSDADHCGGCNQPCDTDLGFSCLSGTCGCATGTECDGKCVDHLTDAEYCGDCDTACDVAAGEVCSVGECKDGCDPLTTCGGSCVDTGSNNDHCGGCGQPCNLDAGQICQGGVCQCVGGMKACGDLCVNTALDPNNCGDCDIVCDPVTEVCAAGVCGTVCPGGQELCNGICVNLDSDPNNCMACGTVCQGGKICQSGCVCPASDPDECGGVCTDTMSDPLNCSTDGTCGNACDIAAGETCSAGVCGTVCPPGQQACGGECVSIQVDENNCGDCGKVCTGGMLCNGGVCGCEDPTPDDCNGVCTNLLTDEENCGDCGVVCSPAEVCATTGGVTSCESSPVVELQVECDEDEVSVGGATQCHATAVLENGNNVPVTDDTNIVWSVESDPNCELGEEPWDPTGWIDAVGLFTATGDTDAEGCWASVNAEYFHPSGAVSATPFLITIIERTLVDIFIRPGNPTIPYLYCENCCPDGTHALEIWFELWGEFDSGQLVKMDDTIDDGVSDTENCDAQWNSSNTAVGRIVNVNSGGENEGRFYLWGDPEDSDLVPADYVATVPPSGGHTTMILVNCGTMSANTIVNVLPSDAPGGLVIAPSTATVAVGTRFGFTAAVDYGGYSFDATQLLNDDMFQGWDLPEFVAFNGDTYLSDDGYDPDRGEFMFYAEQPTLTPEKVTATWCTPSGTLYDEAFITVTSSDIIGCVIFNSQGEPGVAAANPDSDRCGDPNGEAMDETDLWIYDPVLPSPFMAQPEFDQIKGQANIQFEAWAIRSDTDQCDAFREKGVDFGYNITDLVTWTAVPSGIIAPSNLPGEEGKVDMMNIGTAILEADPSNIEAGLPKCTAKINVHDGTICNVYVLPMRNGQIWPGDDTNPICNSPSANPGDSCNARFYEGRRVFKWWNNFDTFDTTEEWQWNFYFTSNKRSTDPLWDPEPLMPNENGWQQQYIAVADVTLSTETDPCAACESECITGVPYPNAVWSSDALNPSHTSALDPIPGQPGLFETVQNQTYPFRTERVTATVPETPDSTTTVTGYLDTYVCGERVEDTLTMWNHWSPVYSWRNPNADAPDVVVAGGTNNYYLTYAFTDPEPVDTLKMPCHPDIDSTTGYLLDVTQEAFDWYSGSEKFATVNNQAPNAGLITGESKGVAYIFGEYNGESANLPIEVLDAVPATCAMQQSGTTQIPFVKHMVNVLGNPADYFFMSNFVQIDVVGTLTSGTTDVDMTAQTIFDVVCPAGPCIQEWQRETDDTAPGFGGPGVVEPDITESPWFAPFNTEPGNYPGLLRVNPRINPTATNCECTITAQVIPYEDAPPNEWIDCDPVDPNEPIVQAVKATVVDYTIHSAADLTTKGTSSCFHPEVTSFEMALGTAEDFFGCVHYSNGMAVPVDHLLMDVNGDDRAIWWSSNSTIFSVLTDTDGPFGGNGGGFITANAQGSATLHSSFPGATETIYKEVAISVLNSAFSSIWVTGENIGAPGCNNARVENKIADTENATPSSALVPWDGCEIPGTQTMYHIWGKRVIDGKDQHLNGQLYHPDADPSSIECEGTSTGIMNGGGMCLGDGWGPYPEIVPVGGGVYLMPLFASAYQLKGPGYPEEVFIINPADPDETGGTNWSVELIVELEINAVTYYNHDYDSGANTSDWAEQIAVLQDNLALEVPGSGEFRTLNFNPFPGASLPVNLGPLGVYDNAFLYSTVNVPVLSGTVEVGTGSNVHFHGTVDMDDLWDAAFAAGSVLDMSWPFGFDNTGANPVAMHMYPFYGTQGGYPMLYYGMVQRAQGVTEIETAPVWGFFHGANAFTDMIATGWGIYSSYDTVFVGETEMTINP